MYQAMRRLYPRGPENVAIAVDTEGATLGPACPLVERTQEGYSSIGQEEAFLLQDFLFGDDRKPDWLFEQSRRIAGALDQGDIARAQIFGLQIPITKLDRERLGRLAQVGALIKANFNPNEPRIPKGNSGGGQWTTGEASEGHRTAVPPMGADGPQLSHPGGVGGPSLVPAQLTVPWGLPADIPWEIPSLPREITPLPFDFPRDPECAEEWAAAYKYCDEIAKQGKFRSGYSGAGKDYRSCLLGQVSERCGGNPTA